MMLLFHECPAETLLTSCSQHSECQAAAPQSLKIPAKIFFGYFFLLAPVLAISPLLFLYLRWLFVLITVQHRHIHKGHYPARYLPTTIFRCCY